MDQKKQLSKEEKSNKRIIKISAVLCTLMLLSLPFYKPTSKNESMTSDASFQCQNFVKVKLQSPSSAKFPWDITAQALGTNKYTLVSYVDAQNTFGATVRTHFKCIVYYDVNNASWELMQLTLK